MAASMMWVLRTPDLRALSAPLIFGSEPKSFPSRSVNEYGIDPAASYPGTVVTDLLRAAEDEAAAVVEEALAEGYKAGRIDAAALWRPRDEAAVTRAEKAERRPTLKDVGLALLAGVGVGALAHAAATR